MLIIHCKFPSFVFFFCQFPPRQFCFSLMNQDYRDHNANIENFHRANIENPEFERFFWISIYNRFSSIQRDLLDEIQRIIETLWSEEKASNSISSDQNTYSRLTNRFLR